MNNRLRNQPQTQDVIDAPVFDATIRWCISFTEKLSSLTLAEDTPCTLLGMIEWHNLKKILDSHEIEADMSPGLVALEEKMVLLEDGIPCSLKQLEEGTIKAKLSLEFSLPHSAQKVFSDSSWADIDKLPIVDMVRTIQQKILKGDIADSTVVSLACRRAKPGYFRQRSMKYKAALAFSRGVSVDAIPQNVANHYVAKDIINRREYLVFGTRTKLSLHSGSGELIGLHISHLC